MRTVRTISATMGLAAVLMGAAHGQNTNPSNGAPTPGAAPTQPAAAPAPAEHGTPPPTSPVPTPEPPANPVTPAPAAPPATPVADGEKGLRLNFRGVSLETVLNYLSDAAGFIIVLEAKPEGKVDVWSNQPLTKDEAVDLLNAILARNNLAALRSGRTLTIVSRDDAKKRNIPVKKGSDPEQIAQADNMVTQIIPVKHANVAQLTANLQPLLGTYAEMTANESANSLVITATETDVRRMAEIVNALDESISGLSIISVFPLNYADAKELANVVKELFSPTTQQQQGNNRGGGFRGGFGGFGGFGGPGGPGGGGNRGGANNNNQNANARVVAVADERSNSLVVGAPDDVMAMVTNLVKQIDQPISDVTELRVFQLFNSDPVEMADMLAQLFPDETRTNDQNQNRGFRFGGGPFGGFGGGGRNNRNNAAAANGSERMKKMGRVLAVPDQRTSSVIVSAAKDMMDQIAEMIAQLDSSPARKQKVFVYNLENADPQEVERILKGMFERTTLQNNMNRNNLNQNSPLTTRGSSQNINNNNRPTGIGGNNTGTGLGTLGGRTP